MCYRKHYYKGKKMKDLFLSSFSFSLRMKISWDGNKERERKEKEVTVLKIEQKYEITKNFCPPEMIFQIVTWFWLRTLKSYNLFWRPCLSSSLFSSLNFSFFSVSPFLNFSFCYIFFSPTFRETSPNFIDFHWD